MKTCTSLVALVIAAICFATGTEAKSKGDSTAEAKVKEVLSNAESKQKVHEAFSAGCFNKCWTLIDKANRSPEDVEDMILLAHASLWHWKQREDCKPLNLSIGYWQISRGYALAGEYGMARLFGEKCLKVGEDNKLAPFYIGYALEALTRAEALHKDAEKARDFLAQARSELDKVTDKDEWELLRADLDDLEKSIPNKPDAGDAK